MQMFGLTLIVLVVFIASPVPIGTAQNQSKAAPLTTVEAVDLERYAGKWYEISKIPNRFQRQCAGNTTAEYALRSDGKIDVTNRCQKEDGTVQEAVGIAEVADTVSNSKLKVSFVRFLWRWWFWGDYWIIGLGKNYDYAIVGTPTRKYGWILSRTPVIDPHQYESALDELRRQGYNPDNFVLTRHQ